MDKRKIIASLYAILAAVFYAINMPTSKMLLNKVEPTLMASFLYFGAGLGIGIMYLFSNSKSEKSKKLTRSDLPYTIGMILLDIVAPILLMFGLSNTTSANASLLNNFEIVATSIIAMFIFKEVITKRLWIAIFLITISSMLLSFENLSSLKFSWGSIFVLLAAVCWGFENNCTRNISSKNTYEIVMLKGIFSGLGSFIIAMLIGERIPTVNYIMIVLVLGFVAYGLSIFFYVRAQNELGAAKTSAYYAIAPFVGTFLSFVFLKEALTVNYIISLFIMLVGSSVIVIDTMIMEHSHMHTHTFMHTHDGSTHAHTINHTHLHYHFGKNIKHEHFHNKETLVHK